MSIKSILLGMFLRKVLKDNLPESKISFNFKDMWRETKMWVMVTRCGFAFMVAYGLLKLIGWGFIKMKPDVAAGLSLAFITVLLFTKVDWKKVKLEPKQLLLTSGS